MTDSIWPELLRPWPTKVIQERKGENGGKHAQLRRLAHDLRPPGPRADARRMVNLRPSAFDHDQGHLGDYGR